MDYSKMGIIELKATLKERGAKGYSTLKKDELVKLLESMDAPKAAAKPAAKPENEAPIERHVKTASEAAPERPVNRVAERQTEYSARPEGRPMGTRPAGTGRPMGTRPMGSGVRTVSYGSNGRPTVSGQTRYGQDRPAGRPSYERPTYDRQPVERDTNYERNTVAPSEDREEALIRNQEQEAERTAYIDRNKVDYTPEEIKMLDTGITKEGIFEIQDGQAFGFIRCDNFLPGDDDVYVAPQMVRKYGLRNGDVIVGNTKIDNAKFAPLLYIKTVNGLPPEKIIGRPKFENLTPIFPNERLKLEVKGQDSIAMRMMDLISPIGKGQRGMIVSQPKAGKTSLIKEIAKSVIKNNPEMHLIILLIDERPEEVTDIKEYVRGTDVEVIYSTFDEEPLHHKRVSEMVIERARRLVEQGQDVMILLDSITRLARAYNLTVTPSGRTLSGGLDPAALHMPKKFFGAARNMREGGSLTILATALVETGSRMDDVVFEEFKGTGNMELVLDRSMAEKHIFPAIDLAKSSTRRDDLLFTVEEAQANILIKRALLSPKADEALENLVKIFRVNKTNTDVIRYLEKNRIV
jgi:transcription termination factor Rho